MKKILGLVVMIVGSVISMNAQENYPNAPSSPASITKAEYFFDIDPGFGKGTAITLIPDQDISNLAATINLNGSGLTNGAHYLYLRTQDANGRWSLANTAFFENFNVPVYGTAGVTPMLSTAEYFIDTDPGTGNGIPVSLPTISDVPNVNLMVNLTNLTPGVHRLFLRTRDVNGKWSISNYAVFDNAASQPYPTAPAAAPAVSQAEYYLDNDPGLGNGHAITLTASTDINNFSFSVPLAGVSQGMHTIYLRSRQNPWSLSAYADFLFGSTLPVQWLYVKGEVRGEDALINWATGEELNADKFIIEYSKDGIQFHKAGEVTATGNVNGSSYHFMHINAGNGTVFYRIKQVDRDGKFTYSKVILLLFQKDRDLLVVFPNPAREIAYISLPPYTTGSKLVVHDITGRVVYHSMLATVSSATSISISNWGSGIYYVSLITTGKKYSCSFIKP